MLHKLIGIYTVKTAIVQLIIVILSSFVVEYLSSDLPSYDIDSDSYHNDDTVTTPHHVSIQLRHSSLPNNWLWYDGSAIYDVLMLNKKSGVLPILMVTVYQATIHTTVVAVFNIFFMMLLLVRAVPTGNALLKLWVLPLAALAFDLCEDAMLLVIILGFPGARYPQLAALTAWCSLIKFVLWFMIAFVDLAAILKLTMFGAALKIKE